MRPAVAIIAAIAIAGTAIVASASTGQPVDHVTIGPGEDMAGVAAELCPQNPGAQLADMQAANPAGGGPGAVLHYHAAACAGQQPTTAAPTTEEPPSTTTTTVAPTTTATAAPTTVPPPTSTVPPTSSTSSSTTVAPSTSTTTSTTVPATTTSTSTTTTTTAAPTPSTTTPGGGGGQSWTANFSTASDFYNQFWTYVGNACNSSGTCEPCSAGVGICQFPGDHDMNCGAPTTSRTVHVINKPELFWHCAPGGDPATGHVMIGLNTSGYAISGFTPRQSFSNIRSICWDQNLTDLGGGKWMVLTIIPVSQAVAQTAQPTSPIRLDYTLPEFDADNAPGDFNVQRTQRLQFKLFRNQLRLFNRLGSFSTGGASDWGTDGGFIAGADKATRYRHCLTENAQGNIVVTQAGQTWQTGVRFPDVPSYVIWADDTYDADKHGGTGRYTWHFDNIEIRTS